VVRGLGDLCDEALDFCDFGAVGGDGDGDRRGGFGGEGVEVFDGFFAGGGFAGGYVDFGAAGLEESVWWTMILARCRSSGGGYWSADGRWDECQCLPRSSVQA